MSSEHWRLVDDLFHAATARSGEARRAFLAESCAGDDDLLREVERLVRAHEAASGFLGTPAAGQAFDVLREAEPSLVGAIVGPYQIVQELGRGGMGAVYLAERADDQFHKRVAVKLIKRGFDTEAVLRRFRDEREILAGLEHPNIAQLLDAGTIADGRPYFLMEYVDGLPIDRFCDERRLTIERRLDLFLQVCTAVSYAHQRLVVHRDIKPSNILVTADGSPKLLDFGIAKMTRAVSSGDTLATGIDLRPMTPEYASPEYIQGRATTTLGDVYSLGVLLFELLTGRLPFHFEIRTPEAIAQVVSTVDAARPSDVAVDRRKQLRGDLDTIVLTALHRDRERRYQSVDALADDIRRHLAGLPILARKDATWYRAVKFVRRNRIAVAAAAAVVASLVGGIAATGWEAIRAGRAERTSRLERDRAAAVSDFLRNDLLAQASSRAQAGPASTPDPNLTVRAALDRAAARIAGRFDREPAIEASIRETIGNTYRDLAVYTQAEKQLARAVALRKETLGINHPDTLHTMQELGVLYFWQGKYAPSASLLQTVLAEQRRVLGDDHHDTLDTMHVLGSVVSALGRHDEAEGLYRQAYEGTRRAVGDEHPDTLAAMNDLVSEYTNRGKYAEAADLDVRLVEIKRRVLGPDHPSTLLSMNTLGVIDRNLGKYADAETILKTCLDTRRRVVGADHIDTLASMNSLALVYQAEAKYADAEPLLLQGLEARSRLLGKEHPQTIAVMNNLAELYRREGEQQKAEALFTEVLEMRRRILGPGHPNTANVLTSLGNIRLTQRRYADAGVLLREALNAYEKVTPDSWQRYYAQSLLGASLVALGNAREGTPLVESGYQNLLQRQKSIPFENQSILDDVKDWASRGRRPHS